MTKLECVVKAMDDKLATHIVAIDMHDSHHKIVVP